MSDPGEASAAAANIHYVVCRICTEMTPPDVASNLFEGHSVDGLSLADVVAMVGDIPVREDEEWLPAWCCFQCQLDVQTAYRVRVLCRESDRKLRKMMLEEVVKTEVVELAEEMEVEESAIVSLKVEKEGIPENHGSDEINTKKNELICKLEIEEPKLSETQESDEEGQAEQEDSDVFEEVPCFKTRCCGCHQFFETREEMLEHAKQEHAVGDPPKGNKNMKLCDICFRLVERRSLQKHQDATMFRCKDCSELFTTAKKVRSHHLMCHYSYRTCCSCNIKFDTVEALREHSDLVHLPNKPPADKDRPFVCNVCYLASKSYSNLYQHRTGKGCKRFQCSQCELSFRGSTDLKRHEAGHRNPDAFRCPVCSKTSRNHDTLRKHIASHRAPADQFRCELCNKVYKSSASLNHHNVSRHGARGKFQCQFCPASFTRETFLNGHCKRFHVAEANMDQDNSTEGEEQNHIFESNDFSLDSEQDGIFPDDISPELVTSVITATDSDESEQLVAVSTETLGGTGTQKLLPGTGSKTKRDAIPGNGDRPAAGLFGPSQLEDLLRQTETGRTLIQRAARAALTKKSQAELVDIIADYHISQGWKSSDEICRQYASAVVSLFTKEKLDTYYTRRGGGKRNIGGRIYNRFGNLKRSKRRREQLEEEQLGHPSSKSPSPKGDPACQEAVEWLRLNVNPWSVTLDKWKASFGLRRKRLQNPKCARECLEEYRHFAEPYGYQLIDIDYALLYTHEYEGIRNWNSFLRKLIPHVALKSRDAHSNELVDFLRSQMSDSGLEKNKDHVACVALMLLNNILKPIRVNNTFLPSIQAAQEDTILFVDSRDDIPQRLNDVYSKYATFDSPPIPKLVFTGRDAVHLGGDFFVCYHSTVYQVESVARAVDVLIKLTQAFGLEFSKLNRKVWIFLARHLYNLNHLAEYASVSELIRKLN